jgi:hypothetical protein
LAADWMQAALPVKGKVERPFRYVREDFFLGGSAISRSSMHRSTNGSIRWPMCAFSPARCLHCCRSTGGRGGPDSPFRCGRFVASVKRNIFWSSE